MSIDRFFFRTMARHWSLWPCASWQRLGASPSIPHSQQQCHVAPRIRSKKINQCFGRLKSWLWKYCFLGLCWLFTPLRFQARGCTQALIFPSCPTISSLKSTTSESWTHKFAHPKMVSQSASLASWRKTARPCTLRSSAISDIMASVKFGSFWVIMWACKSGMVGIQNGFASEYFSKRFPKIYGQHGQLFIKVYSTAQSSYQVNRSSHCNQQFHTGFTRATTMECKGGDITAITT